MEFNVSDPKNIVGISALMSEDNSNSILELEKQIINGTNLQEEEDMEAKQFKRDMERLAKSYDMDGLNSGAPAFSDFNTNDDVDFFGVSEIDNKKNNYGSQTAVGESSYNKTHINNAPDEFIPHSVEDRQLRYMTMEQKKQSYVDDVLNDMADDRDIEFDIDKEKEEDDKNSLLEQIDMLRMSLEDDGTDISNIPIVNKNSSIGDIQNVYKILRLKNDRNHYCSFAEEVILAGAYGMEFLFDGEKEWFGRKPDLVGWSKTVQIKLRRCRYQTSTFVKDIMQEYNMSPGIQLMLELIPSMFLFSRQKKLASQNKEDSRYNEAFSNLNSL